MINILLILLLAATPALIYGGACDGVENLIDPFVTTHFDAKLMQGTFFELAYHDYTQPRPPLCGCERSVKTVDTTTSETKIHDLFSLKCPLEEKLQKDQVIHLDFTVDDNLPGHLVGTTCKFFKQAADGICPDYLIDVGTREPGKPYPWVLEFQCVENKRNGKLLFAGVNMYARDKSNETLAEMRESAEKHGLSSFIENSERIGAPAGLTIVDHTNCTYPPSEL